MLICVWPALLLAAPADQHGDGGLLSDADLNASLALPKVLGADGVVIWGSLHLQSAAMQAQYWKHLREKTGPLVERIHML